MTGTSRYLAVLLLVILANFWVSWDHHMRVSSEWAELRASLKKGLTCVVIAPAEEAKHQSEPLSINLQNTQ